MCFCALLVGLLSACGGEDGDVVLFAANSTSEVAVAADAMIEVHLESNPSTGYRWELSAMSTPDVVELVDRSFEQSGSDEVEGAPGTEVFTFKAASAGAGVLRLEYLRPWEDPPVPDRVVEYIIRIDGAPWPPVPSDTDPPATATATARVIEVSDLVSGSPVSSVTVVGFVVSDASGSRLCEALAESFPPQCGGSRVTIANPDQLDVDLDKEQGVEWTNTRVQLSGSFDGNSLTIGG